jgi:hypothetical protein
MRDAHSGFAILSEVRAPRIWYTSVKGEYHEVFEEHVQGYCQGAKDACSGLAVKQLDGR